MPAVGIFQYREHHEGLIICEALNARNQQNCVNMCEHAVAVAGPSPASPFGRDVIGKLGRVLEQAKSSGRAGLERQWGIQRLTASGATALQGSAGLARVRFEKQGQRLSTPAAGSVCR